MRYVYEASRDGLGAVLQKKTKQGWRAVQYTSGFLTTFEQKYSIEELDVLPVDWVAENLENYVYGTEFEVVSDHKAITSKLKRFTAENTFSSRLTKWVDRLLPFLFTVQHELIRTLGMADWLSRLP